MNQHVFFTGATGFVGARLAAKWLEDSSARLTVMVRSRHGEHGGGRMHEALSRVLGDGDQVRLFRRVSVIEGELGRPQFGLSENEYASLARSVTRIVHCGALVRFDSVIETARRINLCGTEELLALARRCRSLDRFDHMSTAYVAGRRSGVIREDELDEGQEHNNAYERSKFEAECLVSSAAAEVPVVIFRPTLIVCDSRTGELPGNGAFTRMFRSYAREKLPFLPGTPDAVMDLVPVDYVVDAAFALSQISGAVGRRFHLCAGADGRRSLADLIDLSDRHLSRKRPAIVPPEEFERVRGRALAGPEGDARQLIEELVLYLPYLSSAKYFDDANARDLLEPLGLRAPALDAYFDRMAAFMRNEAAM